MADEDTSLTFPMSKSPSTRSEDRGHPERKRRASEDSCEVRETIIGNSNKNQVPSEIFRNCLDRINII